MTKTATAELSANGAIGSKRVGGRGILLSIAGLVGLGVILEIVSRAGIIDPRFLPPFSTVLLRTLELAIDPVFLLNLGATLLNFLVGLAIAIVLGVAIGVALGLSDFVYRSTRTVVEVIRPTPPVALIPLAVLVLGVNIEMKLFIAVFAAVWPVLFNTMYGVHNVDPLAKDMARSFGKKYRTIVRTIVIPAAGPTIWTGIRMSTTITLVVIITVELIVGANLGIGSFISYARNASDPASLYAAVVFSGLLGVVINLGMAGLERRLFRWSLTRERQ